MQAQAASIVACDFYTVESLFLRRYSALFFIAHGSRRVWLAGCTTNPTGAWVTQQARSLGLDFSDQGVRFLIRDRDSKYSGPFDDVFRSEGFRIVKTPVRAPKADAIAERFVRTVRAECLDLLLILNRRHLECVLRVYADHYNRERPIAPSNSGHPSPTSDRTDHLSAKSAVTTGSVDSSTSSTEPPHETRHDNGALHAFTMTSVDPWLTLFCIPAAMLVGALRVRVGVHYPDRRRCRRGSWLSDLARCSSELPFYPGGQEVFPWIAERRYGPVLEVRSQFLHSSDLDPRKPIGAG